MRSILCFALMVSLFLSCSKSNSSGSTPTTTAQDTLNSWTKGSQVAAELDDVWFTDIKHGIAVSGTGLLSSADSGNTWAVIPNTSTLSVFNIQFTDAQYGFVQGNSTLAKSADGGITWTQKTLPTTNAYTFQFLTPALGYYSDYSKGIYKTTDSAGTWNLIFDGTGIGPNFIFDFLDSLHGFVMVNANFSKTTDGGQTWQLTASNITSPTFTTYYRMHFTDTLNGYCASPQGLFKTADGGHTWNNTLPVQTTFMMPYFFDANNGYCLAANAIYKTTNGGLSWTVSCKLGQDDFSGMHFLDMNNGWATTFGGYLLRLKP